MRADAAHRHRPSFSRHIQQNAPQSFHARCLLDNTEARKLIFFARRDHSMSSRGHFVNRSTNREASIAMLHDLTSAEGAICKPDISDVGAVFTQRIPRTLPVIAVVQRVRLYNQVEMCQLPHKINDVDNSLPVIVRELLWSRQPGRPETHAQIRRPSKFWG